MSKYKIIIVDENKDFVRSMEEAYLNDPDYVVVATTGDGMEAITKIEAFKPDIVLIDIVLSNVDGIGVMKSVDYSKVTHPITYIMVSQFSNEIIIKQAISAGASYFIKKPTNVEIVKQRVKQLTNKEDNQEIKTQDDKEMLLTIKRSTRMLDEKINNIFLALGMPAHIKGFQYLKDAVKLIIEDPDLINYITKKLYPEIAKRNSTQAPRVERAIRHAIEVSWNKGKYENLNKIVGMKLYTRLDKPTNGELIALIANKLITEGA